MTCQELREQAAAYALGALEPAEREAVDAHLAEPGPHEGCQEALARAADTAARLADAVPPQRPRDEVWRRITGQLQLQPARRWRPLVFVGLAAAALILILFLALRPRGMDLEREVAALAREPGAQVVPLEPQGGVPYSAQTVLGADGRRAIFAATGLRPSPGKDYELWVIRGDRKLPAGLLRADASGRAIARIDPELLAGGPPDAFAVTIEPAGGVPQPSGPIVLLGKPRKI